LIGEREVDERTATTVCVPAPEPEAVAHVIDNVLFPMEILRRNDREARQRALDMLDLVGPCGIRHVGRINFRAEMQQASRCDARSSISRSDALMEERSARSTSSRGGDEKKKKRPVMAHTARGPGVGCCSSPTRSSEALSVRKGRQFSAGVRPRDQGGSRWTLAGGAQPKNPLHDRVHPDERLAAKRRRRRSG